MNNIVETTIYDSCRIILEDLLMKNFLIDLTTGLLTVCFVSVSQVCKDLWREKFSRD